ncbi:MAG TPA: 2-amino-4-hydroxy-6-hydroxymethyldihydropteridine diphosphokinase [Bosea sp. (in: a-proteobacteria)]|uniref:2-amino-4-hydroxy-6- hydroxymethyldihydropteridine diphosphokinase n=1 Tax=Bosea sp. (in: a-proteobacteria) TaxID=1871050 RepID=UPI002DDD9FF3|nr:2-amino-4-hydroxy-6-hydroxymethyldihydropteridine diphosphokinase [Bosea sp. (in: a-proteobacteria)]HEV2552598.1 2-amino-4-hydroxy-6-hydroxymethyldihydropteridine diphosphokinase [Bosea sp. (in: a-proteobacteria)]
MKAEAALGLGGNLGDPVEAFATVLRRLERHEAVARVRPSSVYRTAPWGKLDQPEFLNMAVLVETDLPARALLDLCLALEREGGRERRERWGPRTLDIDILTYGGQVIDEPGLQIPHPRIAERAFVLAPLAEIAPGLLIGGRSVADLLEEVIDETIRRDPAATERLSAVLQSAPR